MNGEETETLMEKFHRDNSSSSSSDDEKKPESSPSTFKSKVFCIFGREKPIHQVLGGGKPADVFLWRDKKVLAVVLHGVTAIWVLFEQLDYHLLTLVCHSLILTFAVIFVYFNATNFINKAPPWIPEVSIPEDLVVRVALGLRYEMNRGVAFLRSVASGRDLKKFLGVIGDCRIMGAISCWELVQFLDLVLLSKEGLVDLVEYNDRKMFEVKLKEMKSALITQIAKETDVSEVIETVKQRVKDAKLPGIEIIYISWDVLMDVVQWSGKNQQ